LIFSGSSKYGTIADFYNKRELVQSCFFEINILMVGMEITPSKTKGGEGIWAVVTMVVTAVVMAAAAALF
jgi:hypothetical protein